MYFDDAERLNDDGSVTVKIIPSNWHAFNISPDTYHMFNLDSYDEDALQWYGEKTGLDIEWSDINWEYDHTGILRELATDCSNWISGKLMELGLESLSDVSVVDIWSPKEYNFKSDGFEMEITFDPEELKALTPDFDPDDWAEEHYQSRDGFMSFVTNRMYDPEWHAQYDAEFRIEYLLSINNGKYNELGDDWTMTMYEGLTEVYYNNVSISPKPAVFVGEGYKPRVDDLGHVVRYHEGKGWASDEYPEDFFPDLLSYHRDTKLVSIVEP